MFKTELIFSTGICTSKPDCDGIIFRFDVDGFEISDVTKLTYWKEGAGRFQPKACRRCCRLLKHFRCLFTAITGAEFRGRTRAGVIRNPDAPKISTTDFYQSGTAYNSRRFSVVGTFFFIDRSNEQVYIPDDGSIEFAGRSRSYGFELRNFGSY